MPRIDERVILAATLIFLAAATIATAQESSAPAQSVQVFDSPKDLKWGPALSLLPKGAQIAVLAGDPMKDGSPFTLRLKMPDGYKIPAHSHPTDENVTVLSGTLGAGMGDKLDPAKGQLIKPGGFVRMPQGMHHFAWAKGPTTIQVHGVGPFAFTYVNPADDPRNPH
jgi:anti-sigma factor ChrR (cupin superfamily)